VSPATGIAAGAPLTFGSVVTQNFSISVTASRQGTAAYLSMINAQGGANGHKINMIYDDDEGSNSTGLNEVNSLIAQKVFALAAFNAPETEGSGLTPILDQNQIPLIGSYGESSEYMDPYAFAFTADYVHFGYEEGKFLVQKGAKVPAFMFVDNSPDENANNEIERGFKDGIQAAGGNPSAAVFDVVSPTNVSYSSDVTGFMQKKVDGFASILDNTGYVRLLQAQAQNNYYPTEVADPLFDLQSVKSQANTGSHPVYVASDLDFLENKAPMVQQYVNAVTALGETPSYLGEAGWVDAEYLVQAIDKLGTTFTRTQLLAAVNSLSSYNNGFTAPLHISAGKHDMNQCIKFGEISNAVLTQVQGWTCDTETP
jgi:branched-chain amino acid transport system substrate-binding protein